MSFISTMSRIIVSSRSVCSRSGKATFSNTDRSVNSAPNWNSMPRRRRSANSCSALRASIDLAVEADAALVGRIDAADQAQQRRLAAARAAEDGRDLAAPEAQRDVVQDRPARVVAEGDVVDLDEQVGVGVAGGFGGLVDVGHRAQRGSSLEPISIASTARAAWRPSRIAQTTSDWPRRMSPAANTLSTLVA